MKLIDVINAANAVYPDGYLTVYVDPETGDLLGDGLDGGKGDTLAAFIVREIRSLAPGPVVSTRKMSVSGYDVIAIAGALESASGELAAVAEALRDLADTMCPECGAKIDDNGQCSACEGG